MPVMLSDEQEAAADATIRGILNEQVRTIGGYAGTGKTTLITHLYHRLENFAVCAFTGKAADNLRRRGLPANTIHGTIYTPEKDTQPPVWIRKSRDEVGCAGFIIDEASMVGLDIYHDLLSYGLPIIAVGDHGQLPPVGDDAGLMKNPHVRLEEIHRNAGPIARFAEHLRKGGHPRRWKNGDGVWVVNKADVTHDQLKRADQIICAYNRTRVSLNKRVRWLLNREGNEPSPGDRIMCLENSAGVLFNGQQGTAEVVKPSEGFVRFRPVYTGMFPSIDTFYHPEAFNAEKTIKRDRKRDRSIVMFDFCYAITCHKAQGDEWDKVLVFEEKCDLWEHNRWAYTAASRAREKLLWACGS